MGKKRKSYLPKRASEPAPFCIYIDADACPVKREIYRVAIRYWIKVFVVSNQAMRTPQELGLSIQMVEVEQGADVADLWIANHIQSHDICVTSDLPLAAHCIDENALVLTARGRMLDHDSVGQALATRDLMSDLRSQDWGNDGAARGGPPPMKDVDRSRFLNVLDRLVQQAIKWHKQNPKK
jgi:uncharacterized protein